MWLSNLIAGGFVLLMGFGVVFFSLQLPYASEFGPGPGFLPFWLGLVLVGCALSIIVNYLRQRTRAGDFLKPRTRLGLKMLIMIVIAFLLLPLLGFSIGLGLFTAVSMWIMGRHRLVLCGLAAIVTAIGIHFIFGQWLYIPLPKGVLGW